MIPRIAPGQPITAALLNQIIDALNAAVQITTSPPLEIVRTAGGMNLRFASVPTEDTLFATITATADPLAPGYFTRYSWSEIAWDSTTDQWYSPTDPETGTYNAFEINNSSVGVGTNVELVEMDDGDYIFESAGLKPGTGNSIQVFTSWTCSNGQPALVQSQVSAYLPVPGGTNLPIVFVES